MPPNLRGPLLLLLGFYSTTSSLEIKHFRFYPPLSTRKTNEIKYYRSKAYRPSPFVSRETYPSMAQAFPSLYSKPSHHRRAWKGRWLRIFGGEGFAEGGRNVPRTFWVGFLKRMVSMVGWGLAVVVGAAGRAEGVILPPESDWIAEEVPGMGTIDATDDVMEIYRRYASGDTSAIGDKGLGLMHCTNSSMLTFSSHDASRGKTWISRVVRTMRACGVVIIRDVFSRTYALGLREALKEWRNNQKEEYETLSTWQLRKGRSETFPPHKLPFSDPKLLANPLILKILDRYLLNRTVVDEFGTHYCNGSHALLDLVTWISAFPHADGQPIHRDVLWGGSATVHVLLHDLTESFGPTTFRPSTHRDSPLRGQSILTTELMPAIAPMGSVVIYDSSIMHFGGANREDIDRHGLFLDYMSDELHGKKYPFFIKASMYPKAKETAILSTFFKMRDTFGKSIGLQPPAWRPPSLNMTLEAREQEWVSWISERIRRHKEKLRDKRGIAWVD